MAHRIKDPGIGASSDLNARRFINQDGSFNVKHHNRKRRLSETYSYLINISWSVFFGYVFLGYILINSLFAVTYLSLGIESITESTGSIFRDFFKAFFFSAQTITTVGYGAMAPSGIAFGLISSFEAMIGLLSFSFITGLLYGRFSKPHAKVRFSESMVVCQHQGYDALMFRMMGTSETTMIQPRMEVTLALATQNPQGKYTNEFYRLTLERDHIAYLPTTWTIVHTIDESSPLYTFKRESLVNLQGELLLMASYYEESFNQEVHQVHSYMLKNILLDHKFKKAYHIDEEGYTVLDHLGLDHTIPLKAVE